MSNGTAKLVAEPLAPAYASSACYQGQCTHKAGLVSTARPRADNGSAYLFPFTYGYVEARMKCPATPGFFTAFWCASWKSTTSASTSSNRYVLQSAAGSLESGGWPYCRLTLACFIATRAGAPVRSGTLPRVRQ